MIAYFNTTSPANVRSMQPRLSLWDTVLQGVIPRAAHSKDFARDIALNGGRLTDAVGKRGATANLDSRSLLTAKDVHAGMASTARSLLCSYPKNEGN
jgi:hypothetical protein